MRKVVLYHLTTWVGYWPDSTHEPFASFIDNTPKHVVTSTTPTQGWANTDPPARRHPAEPRGTLFLAYRRNGD